MKTREHYKFKVSTNISDLKTNTVWYPGMTIGLHSNVFSHKSQWRGALIFSLICVWTNSWANNQDSGDLKRHRAHFDVTVVTAGLFSICSKKGLIEAVSVQGYRLISIRIPSIRIIWSYDRLIFKWISIPGNKVLILKQDPEARKLSRQNVSQYIYEFPLVRNTTTNITIKMPVSTNLYWTGTDWTSY